MTLENLARCTPDRRNILTQAGHRTGLYQKATDCCMIEPIRRPPRKSWIQWPLHGSPTMHLCLYTATFLPTIGGAEVVLHALASALTAEGHRVTVLAPRVRRANNHVEAPYHLRRYQRPSSKRFGVRQVLLYLLHEYGRRPFDVLHCHGAYPPAYVGATLKRLLNIPMVVWPHGSDVLPGEFIRANTRLERRLRQGLAAADLVIAQSEFLKREMLALRVPDDKIRLIPNGVPVAAFQPRTAAPSAPSPYILAMGSFSPKKGFDVLLRAFASVAAEAPFIHLVMAGAGQEGPAYTALVRAHALRDRVHFVGLVEGGDKIQLYQHCLFFVNSSRREPFAVVNLEALAAGKPLVATAVGGNVEVVSEGSNGFLVPPDDPEALARRMLTLLKEPALRARMGHVSADRARRYDWPVILPQYTAVFEEALARHRDRRR
jgi:glycosyltransferase involved in cell wall biosynthesis